MRKFTWRNFKHFATRKEYWFQQDGTSCHVTAQCLSFLRSKFGDRITFAIRNIIGHNIRQTFHHWFWSQCTQYVNKEKPKNICDLRRRVNEFAENIDEEALRKMVRHNRERAALCIDSLGGHFVQLL